MNDNDKDNLDIPQCGIVDFEDILSQIDEATPADVDQLALKYIDAAIAEGSW